MDIMSMIRELLSESMRLLEAGMQFALPEDPLYQGLVIGLLAKPAYDLLKKVPLVNSVINLGERSASWLWAHSGGWLISKARSGSAKAKEKLDGLLR